MNHLGTLIHKELAPGGEHAGGVDLAGQALRIASTLHGERRRHGSRGSNAKIRDPRSMPIPEAVAIQWVERGIQIANLGMLIDRELPRQKTYVRAIDLTGRIVRRARTMYNELLRIGARKDP
jgi:hypothetical protein